MNLSIKLSMLSSARSAANCLYNAQRYLNKARGELSESISINNRCFKSEKIDQINNGINSQIQLINSGVIPAIMAIQVDK